MLCLAVRPSDSSLLISNYRFVSLAFFWELVRACVTSKLELTVVRFGAGVRQFHATGAKRYSDDYIHADHMYNITAMKNRKLKMGVGVFGSLAIGIMVPIWAVQFQMKKAGGGV